MDQHERGYVVTVFLKLHHVPEWAGQQEQEGHRYVVEDLIAAVRPQFDNEPPNNLQAALFRQGRPIPLGTDEAEIEATVILWKPQQAEQGA